VNGAGKSTLIKTIAGELAPLTGESTTGKGLNIGYFAQHQVEMLRHDESPLWHLAKIAPTTREQELRNFLGGFNFPGTMVTSSIAPFSGGEKARLALALIVWQRPNLLLLDEPTNHLDLETREALTEALAQFEGTLVVVSHDRHLLRATTDQFIIVADGKLQPFDGDLDDYKDWLFQTKLGKGTDVLPAAGKANKTASRCSRQCAVESRSCRAGGQHQGTKAQGGGRPPAPVRAAQADRAEDQAPGRADRQAHGAESEVDAQLGESHLRRGQQGQAEAVAGRPDVLHQGPGRTGSGMAGLQEQLEALA
jgi:ATP-binding cassette subfamily F protein 3